MDKFGLYLIKDDYNDEQFDSAIKNCDYNVAWSNPNFELWLLSHFLRK